MNNGWEETSMHDDDEPVGYVLSRREALTLPGATGVSVLGGRFLLADPRHAFGAGLPSCIVRPEQTEGPYFRDEKLHRFDIRSDPTSGSVRAGASISRFSFLGSGLEHVDRSLAPPSTYGSVTLWVSTRTYVT